MVDWGRFEYHACCQGRRRKSIRTRREGSAAPFTSKPIFLGVESAMENPRPRADLLRMPSASARCQKEGQEILNSQ